MTPDQGDKVIPLWVKLYAIWSGGQQINSGVFGLFFALDRLRWEEMCVCKCLFYVVGIDVSAYFCVTIVTIRQDG